MEMELGKDLWWVYVIIAIFLLVVIVASAILLYMCKYISSIADSLYTLCLQKDAEKSKSENKDIKELSNKVTKLEDTVKVQNRKIDIMKMQFDKSNSIFNSFTRSK